MNALTVFTVIFSIALCCNCESFHPRDIYLKKNSVDNEVKEEGRSLNARTAKVLKDVFVCLATFDASCAVDKAHDGVIEVNKSFWGKFILLFTST